MVIRKCLRTLFALWPRRRMTNKTFLLFVALFAFAIPIRGQSTAAQPASEAQENREVDPRTADIAITATVHADELEFEIVPKVTVTFSGAPERLTEWTSNRENLPDKVEPKVIYRDIGITLKIVSVFADIERIVDEALGLIPPSPPATASQEAPAAPEQP